ncbi:sensor domain-containing protein [Yinghuangia sp. YIM S10712]|uniref:sensor domain-containing protein n=1 Tax=Yinghuangia sp. YIM S10712 TaxID=3436930 RepID=UPI003F531CC6
MSRPRITRLTTAAVSLPVLLWSTACGVGAGAADVADAAKASHAASAPATTPPATRSPGPTVSESPPRGGYLTREQLSQALLGEDDMPEGWVVSLDKGTSPAEDAPDSEPSSTHECSGLDLLLKLKQGTAPGQEAATSIMAYDSAGGGKAYAITGIALASFSSDSADRLLADMRELLSRCDGVTVTAEEGARGTYTRQSAPALGDDALAFAITTRMAGKAWVHAVVAIRVGSTIVESTHVNLTGTSVVLPDESMLRKQVDQLRAVMAENQREPGA